MNNKQILVFSGSKIYLMIFLLISLVGSLAAEVIWSDNFEGINQWTLNGEFEIGQPQGAGGNYGNPDPESAVIGDNVLGNDLSGNGDYGANIPDRGEYAISPIIDCSNYIFIELSFMRWLNVEQPTYDQAHIDVSVDGGNNWEEVWSNESGIEDDSWREIRLDISQFADDASQMQLRFSIGPTDGSWFYSGWNIDNVQISGIYALFAEVSGNITHAVTGAPMADVEVFGNVFGTTTDSEGNYQLDVLVGENTLTARLQNYFEEYVELDLEESESVEIDLEMVDYSPPENLVATIASNDVFLEWEAPQYQPQALSAYNVYRDGILLETTTQTAYQDLNLIGDAYEYYITAIYTYGTSAPSNLVEVAELAAEDLSLSDIQLNNYPNPFNPETTIAFNLQQACEATLTIFNLKGQVLRSFHLPDAVAGENKLVWDGTDADKNPVASGLYLYRLDTDHNSITKRMMLLK